MRIALTCPICDFRLRGSAKEGYRCVRCHAHYSTAFVRRLRREHFRGVIDSHFGKKVDQEEQVMVLEDDEKIVETAIEEAEQKVEDLEGYLEMHTLFSSAPPIAHADIQESFEKPARASYAPRKKTIVWKSVPKKRAPRGKKREAKKPSRKSAAKKKPGKKTTRRRR